MTGTTAAPVAVVIADVANETDEPELRGVLEPLIKSHLERAPFTNARTRAQLETPDDRRFDVTAARQVAVQRSLDLVLSAQVRSSRSGPEITVSTIQALTGDTLSVTTVESRSRSELLRLVARAIKATREALGEQSADSTQSLSNLNSSISTESLDAAKYYAAALEASSHGRFGEARESALRAVEIEFGIGYLVLAIQSRNMGLQNDAVRYVTQALEHLDRMNERERLSTRGMYFRLTGDYRQGL